MINPYTFYIIGFGFSLIVYQLGWSEVYPSLGVSLIAFLLATMVAHFLLSRIWVRSQRINVNDKEAALTLKPKLNPWLVTGFIYLCWAADFIYERGIPLVKMIMNVPFNYKMFGFPSLHVFTFTFTSFYCIYLFHYFLRTKKRVFLLLYFVNMASAILIYNRGMLCINLASSFFLYLLHLRKIPYRKLFLGIPLLVAILYLFGVMGTVRVSFETKRKYDQNYFLETGKATTQFRKSSIPKEFFWPYIYISSPIANLQVNINTYVVKPITTARILEYINNEWLFESLSKRINKLAGIEREKENAIKEPFNASTVYCRSFSYLGWAGVIATSLFVLILPFLYSKLIYNNSYQTIAIAILCTTYLFLTYDNTIRIMAFGFQLAYPVIFPWVENNLSKIKLLQ